MNSLTRRQCILNSALGFSALALNGISASEKHLKPDGKPHFVPKAKRVIWLFMRGGVSHMESFDPKPMLNKYAGKTISETPYKSVLDPEKQKTSEYLSRTMEMAKLEIKFIHYKQASKNTANQE